MYQVTGCVRGWKGGRIAWLSGLLLILALLAAAVPADRTGAGAAPRANPLLLQMAEERPDEIVSVIVQKSADDDSVERQVAALGGRVTMDLHMINAFAAELPARAVPTLARSEGVRWVSLDAPVNDTGKKGGGGNTTCPECVDTSDLQNAYVSAVGADKVWNEAPYLQGQGMTIAVVDSGIKGDNNDFGGVQSRVITNVKSNAGTSNADDGYGHGTHIAGIIGGNGAKSSGAYLGIAPKANLINVKVSDDTGTTSASANTGLAVSDLLTTGSEPLTRDSATWNSVNWGSVNWGSVNWDSTIMTL